METAIVEYCKKFQKNLIKRTGKTDVSLFKDEFGFELPDEIADYINLFWHSGISGYTNCPECIVLFPVQKKKVTQVMIFCFMRMVLFCYQEGGMKLGIFIDIFL